MAQRANRHEPMYGWALDSRGRPIPIAGARRGAHGYLCPICGETMIARKGDVKQHHFAHDAHTQCTPERVAAAIAGKWLVLELGKYMVLEQPCMVQWTAGGETFRANLLDNIVAIVEGQETEFGQADIALVDSAGKVRSVIDLETVIDEARRGQFASNGIPIIILPTQHFRSGQMTLPELLAVAQIRGGWQLLGSTTDSLQTNPQQIRETLSRVVNSPPYRFWSKLSTIGNRNYVLPVGNELLWLPHEMWQAAVGGTINRLTSDLIVTIQEWPQPDGSNIVLYYVALRHDDCAIAIRRFQRGEHVHAKLNAAYHMKRTTAEDVARLLATG